MLAHRQFSQSFNVFSIFGSKNPAKPDNPAPADAPSGWLSRLKSGLSKTRAVLNTDVSDLFARHPQIDEALYEELESTLLSADVGIHATNRLIENLREAAKEKRIADGAGLKAEFEAALVDLVKTVETPLDTTIAKPFVIMIAGVNGAGKTTTIGKLAKHFQAQGKSVMLAAGDTFRAAAREQLMTWGERNNVTVIAQDGADAAAVIFDAIQSAKARGIDIVLADTAGRLPTQLHLMEEIKKVKRVIAKADPTAPHESLLVLDANTGQNALQQVRAFDDALQLTGLVVTKLDGTAKGGMIAALAADRPDKPIPVRFIGVGEGIEDLQPFHAQEFVTALFR
ncbi:MAG: signal recognition particle-docking protein FtsY [Betaproteobacteria bacterium]|nr:signal recognition particle-docking protein FtsY [Betaproteobacteria bacterium]